MDENIYRGFLRDIHDIKLFQDYAKTIQSYPKLNFTEKHKRFNPLTDLSEKTFMAKYRFSKDNMQKIIDLIKEDLDNPDMESRKTPQVPIDLQVIIAIRYFGSGHALITCQEHEIHIHTLSKICKRIVTALASKKNYVRMPVTLSERNTATTGFQSIYQLKDSKLTNVIGAIHHHSVSFFRQSENNQQEEKIQVQIIADAFCKIRDVECFKLNDKCNVNDIFLQSRIKERFEQNEFRGRILLGCEKLNCTNYVFTPVCRPKTSKEKSYNRFHLATFEPAEQCLRMWRQRFPVLDQIHPTFQITTARNTITALAVLHNLAIDWNDPTLDYNFEELDHDAFSKVSDGSSRSEFIKSNF